MSKWVDKNNGWEFDTDRIYKKSEGNQILRYVDDLKEFSSEKSYYYKIKTRNLANLPSFTPTLQEFNVEIRSNLFDEFSEEYNYWDIVIPEDSGLNDSSFPARVEIRLNLDPLNRDTADFDETFVVDFTSETGTFDLPVMISEIESELNRFKNNFFTPAYYKIRWGLNAELDPKSFTIGNVTDNSFEIITPHINYVESSTSTDRIERFRRGGFSYAKIFGSTEGGDSTKGLSIKTNWNDEFRIGFLAKSDKSSSFTENKEGFLFFNSSPNITSETNNYINFDSTALFDSEFGIENIEIHELDWVMNGISWINDDPDLTTLNSRGLSNRNDYCNGWAYKKDTNSFIWYNLKSNNNSYYPMGDFPKNENENYNKINYISKYINLEKFNLSFQYTKAEGNITSSNSGIKLYLCNSRPPVKNNIDVFDRFLENSILLEEINDNGSFNFNYVGLSGNKYLVFVGDVPDTNNEDNLIVVSNIKIQGEYLEENNKLFEMDISNNEISIDLENALYSTIVGTGKIKVNDDGLAEFDNIEPSEIISKIGNSYFNSGIWENGIWNSGYRDDKTIREMYDIIYSVKINSDKVWRVGISGPQSSINANNFSQQRSKFDRLEIGDKISLSNIIGIDINENRKTLKGLYNIVNISNNSIEIEIETSFPLRRIERDSNNHRILLTRNIWLSGGFLNGYFKGIWNYGLFRGYPINTKMEDSHWVEGIYNGGHFKGEEILFGDFSDTFYSNDRVGITFPENHNLAKGDIISINKDDKSKNPQYDGEHRIIEIPSNDTVILDLEWGQNIEDESGKYSTGFGSSLIQRMDFDSINTSRITSNNTLESPVVFNYNSWIDVNYYTDSAVNIGKPQTVLNKNSRRYYSENNLYGYPTNDVLESNSTFRDSFSLDSRIYSLGTKYKEFDDYIGDSSSFSDFFGSEGEDLELFLEKGWTFSIADVPEQNIEPSILFDRTESLGGFDAIDGEELNIKASGNGAILDIDRPTVDVPNRTLGSIPKSRYTAIEFDLVKFEGENDEFIPFFNTNISGNSVSLVNSPEPVIHFDNINKVNRLELVQLENGLEEEIVELRSATYLPVFENINHIKTKKKRKIEYFFNKRHLSMNIRGNGNRGENESDVVVDNLRLYEVNMIPFFKYFNDVNINKSVQIPLTGVSRYIDFNEDISIMVRNLDFDINEIELNKTDINFEDSGIDIGIVERNFEVSPVGLIELEVNQLNFDIIITADDEVQWTVDPMFAWIDVESDGTPIPNGEGGSGDAVINVTLEPNTGGQPRIGTIEIEGNGETIFKGFRQPVRELEVVGTARFSNPDTLEIENDNASINVLILTNIDTVEWTLTSSGGFVNKLESPSDNGDSISGTGNSSVTVTLDSNNSTEDRSDVLFLSYENGEKTKELKQLGTEPVNEDPDINAIQLQYFAGSTDPCIRNSPSSQVRYIDTLVFETASSMYLDSSGGTLAPNGWYAIPSGNTPPLWRYFNSNVGENGTFVQNKGCPFDGGTGGGGGGPITVEDLGTGELL